jgi:hypothetical protein
VLVHFPGPKRIHASLLYVFVFCPLLLGQASVPESQETALIYVDAHYGSNLNSGSQTSPLRTIAAAVTKALANNQKSVGTRIVINPGTYREVVIVAPQQGGTAAPLTLQAAQTGTAIVSGTALWTEWQPSGANDHIFAHAWPYTWGLSPLPVSWPSNTQPITRRREMLFVDAIPLTQVISPSLMKVGTFAVDENAGLVYMWPPSGIDTSTMQVEVGINSTVLQIQGMENVVVRGLVFQHAISQLDQNAAVTINTSSNILLDHDSFLWNNWTGLQLNQVSRVTVQNSVANHNGGLGMGLLKSKYVELQYNDTSYNNWRGALGALYDWNMGGTKLMGLHEGSVQNSQAIGNQAQGLWFDTDNVNVTASNLLLSKNHLGNFQIEADEGPITVQSSRICYGDDSGIFVATSEGVSLSDNVLYNNGVDDFPGQIYVGGNPNGRNIKNWETGQSYHLTTQNLSMHGNTAVAASRSQYTFGSYLSGTNLSDLVDTLSSDSNRWYDPVNSSPFVLAGNKFYNLSGWQATTGQDLNSTFGAPSAKLTPACATPAPSTPDFVVYTDQGSQSVSAGGRITYNLTVKSFAFTGAVDLSLRGLPSNTQGLLSTYTINTAGTTTLTVQTSGSTPAGSFPLTVLGTSGSVTRAVTFWLVVY